MSASPPRLSAATADALGAAAPPAGWREAEIGVVHFGPGAFFRAHQVPVYDRLLAGGDRRWGVCGVSLHSREVRDALEPQDGLYTVVRLGEPDGLRVAGALRRLVVAPERPDAVRAVLAAPTTRVVGLTVTEKGHHLAVDGGLDTAHPAVAQDLAGDGAAGWRTIYGWLAEAVCARRAAGLPPLLLLSADNLPGNGGKLKRALQTFLRIRGEAATADWAEAALPAPDTMVDCITPATDDALRAAVAERVGVADAWPVQREPFWRWVIGEAGHPALAELAAAGVTVTGDVGAHERAKLRLLNGPHSTLAYLGRLAGCALVSEAMAEPRLARFVETLMRRDLAPTVDAPEIDLDVYAGEVLDRFRNAAVRHRLEQIAADGSQKLPARLGAAAAERLAAGADVRRFAWPYAAWMRWLERGFRDGPAPADPLASALREAAEAACGLDADDAAALYLERSGAAPPALSTDPGFRAALARAYALLGGADPLAGLRDAVEAA